MRILVAALLLAMAGPSLAAEIVVTNGDTLQLDRTIYRLDGIDAPEIDQSTSTKAATSWPCGLRSRSIERVYWKSCRSLRGQGA